MNSSEWIKRQVLLQLKVRDQTARSLGLPSLPRTLDVIEEMARTIDATNNGRQQHDSRNNNDKNDRSSLKRRGNDLSNENKPKFQKFGGNTNNKSNLHCDNHPHATNHHYSRLFYE